MVGAATAWETILSKALIPIGYYLLDHPVLLMLGVLLLKKKRREEIYESLFLQPIRGGNGVTQMDELAKWAVVVIFVVEFFGHRDPIVMGELLTSVMIIAGYKHYITHKYGKGNISTGDKKPPQA